MDLLSDLSVWAAKASLQGSFLAATLWLIYRMRRTSQFFGIQYILGAFIIARLCLPTTPTFAAHPFNWVQPIIPGSPGMPQSFQHVTETREISKPQLETHGAVNVSKPVPIQTTPITPNLPWAKLFTLLWALGCVFGIARLVAAHVRHRSLLRNCIRLEDPPLHAMLQEIQDRLGIRQSIELLSSSQIASAAVTGTLRPKLIVSSDFLARLKPDQRRHIITHELVHIKRFDPFLNWLSLGLQAIHWFNPLVHWALRKFQQDRELVCDALAIKTLGESQRAAYGETLIEVLTSFRAHRSFPNLVPIASNKHEIKRRIIMISTNQSNTSKRPLLLFAGLTLVLAITFTRPATARAQGEGGESRSFDRIEGSIATLNISPSEDQRGHSRIQLSDASSRGKGEGVLVAPGTGKQIYNVHEIDLSTFQSGGVLLIDIQLGDGESAGSFDLFPEGVPLPSGSPVGSVARVYDVPPEESRTMVYQFNKGEVLRFGASGNWFSEKGTTNNFKFEARAVPLQNSGRSFGNIPVQVERHVEIAHENQIPSITLHSPEQGNTFTLKSIDTKAKILNVSPHAEVHVQRTNGEHGTIQLVNPGNQQNTFTIEGEGGEIIRRSPEATLNIKAKPSVKKSTYFYQPEGKAQSVTIQAGRTEEIKIPLNAKGTIVTAPQPIKEATVRYKFDTVEKEIKLPKVSK